MTRGLRSRCDRTRAEETFAPDEGPADGTASLCEAGVAVMGVSMIGGLRELLAAREGWTEEAPEALTTGTACCGTRVVATAALSLAAATGALSLEARAGVVASLPELSAKRAGVEGFAAARGLFRGVPTITAATAATASAWAGCRGGLVARAGDVTDTGGGDVEPALRGVPTMIAPTAATASA
jgi:hypothetical protein